MRTMTLNPARRCWASRQILPVFVASALAGAALAGVGRSEAVAGLAVPAFAARDGVVLAQASPEPGRKAKSAKPKSTTKKRAVRCGAPGLPACASAAGEGPERPPEAVRCGGPNLPCPWPQM